MGPARSAIARRDEAATTTPAGFVRLDRGLCLEKRRCGFPEMDHDIGWGES